MVIPYLKITRPINLLLIVMAMCLIKFRLFELSPLALAMGFFEFGLLLFATICIAAGGNVINDIYDLQVDAINKPERMLIGKEITEKDAFRFYLALNILGVVSGFWLANLVGKPSLAVVFILCSVLLYWYATYLKSIVLIGNILISLLVGLSLLMTVLFDLFPMMTPDADVLYITLGKTVFYYAMAGIGLNFVREIVKDIQDINGDKNGGRTSLPIILGASRSRVITFAIGVFYFFLLILFCYYHLYDHSILLFYFLFLVGGPLGLFCIKAWQAEKKKDFLRMSLLLKLTMFTGVGSLVFIENLIY